MKLGSIIAIVIGKSGRKSRGVNGTEVFSFLQLNDPALLAMFLIEGNALLGESR